jgi:hypothetical protein
MPSGCRCIESAAGLDDCFASSAGITASGR